MSIEKRFEKKSIIEFLRSQERLVSILDLSSEDRHNISDAIRQNHAGEYDQEAEDSDDFIVKKYNSDFRNIYDDVSNSLFILDNGAITIRQKQLEAYNHYTTALDIYPFFATYLAKISLQLQNEEYRTHYLLSHLDETHRFYGNLEKKISKISDLHIHFGAALDFHYRISELLVNPDIYDDGSFRGFPKEITLLHNKVIASKSFFSVMSIVESVIVLSLSRITEDTQLSQVDELSDVLGDAWGIMYEVYVLGRDDSDIKQRITTMLEIVPNIRNVNHGLLGQFIDELPYFDRRVLQKALIYFNPEYVKENIHQGLDDRTTKRYNPKMGDKLLVLYMLYKLQFGVNNTILERTIEAYMMLRNMVKSLFLQQHRRTGYGYFSSYARSALKGATNRASLSHPIESIMHPKLSTNAEIRLMIPSDRESLHNQLVDIDKELDKLQNSKLNYNLKVMYHYLKRDPDNKQGQKVYYEVARKRVQKDTRILTALLTSESIRFENQLHRGGKKKDRKMELVDLAQKYFHGIDAAGSELIVPPEVYAPAYAFFKRSIISSGLAVESSLLKHGSQRIDLQYTFHAGEEFRDILSGLRTLFEAVVFLNLKDEDRIGHGVALGLSPKLFFADRDRVVLTVGEYMDNLLFLYFLFASQSNPPFIKSTIEEKVIELGNIVYGGLIEKTGKNYTINDYIDAWLLRRNDPYVLTELLLSDNIEDMEDISAIRKLMKENGEYTIRKTYQDGFARTYTCNAIPDFVQNRHEDEEPLERYRAAKNNPNAFEIYWAQARKHYKIPKKRKEYYNGTVEFEYDIYEYAQDLMMEKYIAGRDIVIEVMPTSNLLITPIRHYDEHPLLRLHPPQDIIPNKFGLRNKKIKIVVATDNPGIQGTNLMMELHIVQNIVAKKYGKRVADEYILSLVEQANYLFDK